MKEQYFHKICTNCNKPFKTLVEEYLTCVYCWYDKLFPRKTRGYRSKIW